MYPHEELTQLAVRKAELRREIAQRRARCVAAATRLAQPLALIDRLLAFWRRLSPLTRLVAAPLGLLVTRTGFPRFKALGFLARWGPLVYGAARGIVSAVKSRPSAP